MRFLMITAAALMTATSPAFAQDADTARQATEAEARKDGPVGCIGGAVPRTVDRDVLTALVLKGFEAENNEEKSAYNAVSRAIANCRGRFGWGDARQAVAVNYFRGSTLRGNAAYKLRDYGVEWHYFIAAVEAMPQEDRDLLMNQGSISAAALTAAIEAIDAQGATLGAAEPDASQEIASALAQGLAGTIIVNQAIDAY
ncbi:hypothetical protein [Stakelama tenebrarum]|uniref:Uncharacterized protein n=1 Tax=Stakelama tenebrarum TaxID=2711215 RepID=A0A6G6Y642_9SPHN|nr:hypothetical protein [Sphingosinithalassobacter tenebrarum]QIG80369.1 hypothetical protein G5C33_11670 [Sphingosinithalassobacter tenebrarum]